ncbi:alpha/beta hydrolase family protein [Lysobacter humi (ex Lee et al. 2017)]
MSEVGWCDVAARDGHRWAVLCARPAEPRAHVVWLPALGVAARHYEPFAQALAAHGVAVTVHEWRGLGSSNLRASRREDWGYRELLLDDIPATRGLAARDYPAPPRIGGHSLGGQLAACAAALDPQGVEALWLVASGSPWPGAFPRRTAWWLPVAYQTLRSLARLNGSLPGRRLGFGGNEARSVIHDWSGTALTGRYAAPGVGDLEPRLATLDLPVRAAVLDADWLAPASSLRYLVGKTASHDVRVETFDTARLGVAADHFAWMRSPAPIAAFLTGLPDTRVTPSM